MNLIKDLEQAIDHQDKYSVSEILSQDLYYAFPLLGRALNICAQNNELEMTEIFIEKCLSHLRQHPAHKKYLKTFIENAVGIALLVPHLKMIDLLFEKSGLYSHEEIGYRLSRHIMKSVEVGDELIGYLLHHPYVNSVSFINSVVGQAFIQNCLYHNRVKSLVDIFSTPELQAPIRPFIKEVLAQHTIFQSEDDKQTGNIELLEYALDNLQTYGLDEKELIGKIIRQNFIATENTILQHVIIRQNYSEAFILGLAQIQFGVTDTYKENYEAFCKRIKAFYEKKNLHEKLHAHLPESTTGQRRKI